ncbi:MAG: hypothetical protein QF755_04440 [Candidatus Peribacteraceae bacterium]|nr:hypothetical protein [Candidatus Peribacteraceae bacterium]HCI03330.1 hypothetical protein [Candidatus Peribacteria bacterium]
MLKPPRRLPKRYNRPVTPMTKRLVKKHKRRHKKSRWKDFLHKFERKGQRAIKSWWRSCMWWILITLFGLILLGFGLLIFSPLIQVREVKVVRFDSRLDIEEVQKILTPFFGKHLFFLPTHEVASTLEDAIKDLEDISISKLYPSELSVKIKLDPLISRIKIIDPDQESDLTSTGATVDYLTDEGVYVIVPLPEDSKSLPVIGIVDWGVRPVEGDVLVVPRLLERMSETEKALSEQFGHSIAGRTVYIRAQEYHLHLDKGIDIWFDMVSPLDEQLLRYRTFLKSVNTEEVKKYIDLRVSDRVVYK